MTVSTLSPRFMITLLSPSSVMLDLHMRRFSKAIPMVPLYLPSDIAGYRSGGLGAFTLTS